MFTFTDLSCKIYATIVVIVLLSCFVDICFIYYELKEQNNVTLMCSIQKACLLHTTDSLLSVPRTRTTYGDRSFAVSGPVAWNSLPVALRSSDVTEETFRRHLKTFLFNCFDN